MAHANLRQALAGDDRSAVQAAIDRVQEAQWDAAATVAGRARTSDDKLRSEASVLAGARRDQVALMPPARDGATPAEQNARAQIGALRERIAYSVTHAVTAGDHDPAERWVGESVAAQESIRELSAEFRFPMRDGGEQGYPEHCADCGRFHGRLGDCRPDNRAAALYSTPARWGRIVSSSDPEDQAKAVAAGQHMARHGHLQCGTCGQWRSVRFEHTCPRIAKYLPVHPDFIFTTPPPDSGNPPPPSHDDSDGDTLASRDEARLAAAAAVRDTDYPYQSMVSRMVEHPPTPDQGDPAEVSVEYPQGPMVDNHNQLTGDIDTERVDAHGRARPVLARNLAAERATVEDTIGAIRNPTYPGSGTVGEQAATSAVRMYERVSRRDYDATLPGATAALDRVYDAATADDEAQLQLALHDVINQQYATSPIGCRAVDPDDHPGLFPGRTAIVDSGGRYAERVGAKAATVDRYATPKEIAQRVRADVKRAQAAGWLPTTMKVSVTSDRDAVRVTIGNVAESWRRAADPDRAGGSRSTVEAEELRQRVEAFRAAYNRDSSDAQSDYHHASYYGSTSYDWRT